MFKKIKVCPYNVDLNKNLEYSHPEATGFIQSKDALIYEGRPIRIWRKKFTILESKDNWIWNKVANITVLVK